MKHIKLFEDFLDESAIYSTHNGTKYKVDFIKNKAYDKHSSPSYDLLLTDTTTGIIYRWPEVFTYTRGYTQGTNKSEYLWFLETKEYGGVSQGSGTTKPSEPRFIMDQLEYIINHWQGKGYSSYATTWYQNNVIEYPPKTPKSSMRYN